MPADAATGPHRIRVLSGSYALTTRTYDVVAAASLRVLGAQLVDRSVVFRAQNPTPDTTRSVAWRPISPEVNEAQWPAHMGTGNGRPPGPFGEGTFPP